MYSALKQISQKRSQNLHLHPHKNTMQITAFEPSPSSHLISFIPITVPHVECLPHGAETTSDVDPSHHPILMTAVDRTKKQVEDLLIQLKPNIVFFDFTYWLPDLAGRLGIKSVQYGVTGLVAKALLIYRETQGLQARNNQSGFPDIGLDMHEEKTLKKLKGFEFGSGVRFIDRLDWGAESSDAAAFKNCREMEGPFVDYLEKVWGRRILLSGPVTPEPHTSTLEPKWDHLACRIQAWLCNLLCIWKLCQFQELMLGLEQSGMPFLVAAKSLKGYESVEASLPEGFEERVRGRGIVHGGWVQQQLILEHSSVGCFITHCGSGSMLEALLSQCQLVLLPTFSDQIINARRISERFKAGVEVKKGEEDGFFTKESVCEAVRSVMNEDSEIAKEIRANHAKLRNILLSNNFDSTYIDNFCHQLQGLLKC